MKVAEVMTRGVDVVDPSETVQNAAIHMAELDIGAVLIGSKTGLQGILTDRDIILRVVVDGRNPAEIAVRDVMSSTLYFCNEDDAVEEIFAQMRERQIRRMPVLDAAGEFTGIVTFGDLAKNVSSPEQLAETLREISEPHRSRRAVQDEPADTSADREEVSSTANKQP
jgi:CBS domain-containing protein